MADSNTTTYSFTLPEVGASADSWGTKLNANWDKVDDLLDGSIAVNGITVTGGSIDGTAIGANSASTGEFTSVDVTGTVTADGLTVDGQGTFTTSDNSAQVTLISTDTDALVGPKLNLWRNSGVGSNGDLIGEITFTGEDTVGSTNTFATISTIAEQASNGSEDGSLHIKTLLNGTLANRISVGSASSGGDIKFYEDTGTTAKFVWDSSAESLGIGSNAGTIGNINTRKDADADVIGVYISNESTGASASSTYWNDAQGNNFYITTYGDGHARSNETWLGSTAGSSEIVFSPNNTERMRIDSAGNVGIGTASPSFNLQVADATESTFRVNQDGAGASAVQLTASNGSTSINSTKGGQPLTFGTANAERARIDSSGNLLVGTTTVGIASTTSQGLNVLGQYGAFEASRNNASLFLNRLSTDGDIAVLRKDGSTVGSIGAEGGDLVIGTGSTAGLQFNDATPTIRPWNMSANTRTDGVCDLGYSNSRFKDLYLSGDINIDNMRIGEAYSGDATGFDASAASNTWHKITAVNFNAATYANRTLAIEVKWSNNNPPFGYACTATIYATIESSNVSSAYDGPASIGCSANGTMGTQLPLTVGTHTNASSLVVEAKMEIIDEAKRLFIRTNSSAISGVAPQMKVRLVG